MKTKDEILISKIGPCQCEEIYTSRGRKDPDCAYCEIGPDMIDAMQKYADQETAELRRQVEELKEQYGTLRMQYDNLLGYDMNDIII